MEAIDLRTPLLALALTGALVAAGPLLATASTPRTETYDYVLGADGFTFVLTLGSEEFHIGSIKRTVQAGDQQLRVDLVEPHGQPVAGTLRVERTAFPFEATVPFCRSIAVPLASTSSIEVAVTDPLDTAHLVDDCPPYQGTAGRVVLTFS